MAVLPPPSTMTRLPILLMWPNETEDSQSMPIWMLAAASLRPGMSSSRPRGAPEPTKIASQPSASSAFRLSMRLAADELDADIEDVIAFLVDDRFRQPEARDLRADHAARLRILVEDRAGVAERREVACDRERGRAAAHQRDALAVLNDGRLRQPVGDVVLVVGGHALQAADGDRVLFDAPAPAGRLAGTVAGAPEDSGKHVRLPVDHVGVAEAACRDQPDVFGDRGVRRACPLAIHDLVEVVRCRNVGILIDSSCPYPCRTVQCPARAGVGRSFPCGPAYGCRFRAAI
jgi:hypothetical protein